MFGFIQPTVGTIGLFLISNFFDLLFVKSQGFFDALCISHSTTASSLSRRKRSSRFSGIGSPQDKSNWQAASSNRDAPLLRNNHWAIGLEPEGRPTQRKQVEV